MIALTGRLNERDETIIQLQEELDAYDRLNRETEQHIEAKNHRIDQLVSFIQNECQSEVPPSMYQMGSEDMIR
jgi:kinesin family protein 3/17